MIPVRYVGLKKRETDHLYGSNVGFLNGKVSQVPDWAAARLLAHPEFEDARPKDKQGEPIIATREMLADEEAKIREELDALQAHVNIDNMTRDQLSSYAMRTYGVNVDPTDKRDDVVSKVRSLMRARGAN